MNRSHPISESFLKPISQDEADAILNNKELQDECYRLGVDLGSIVNNMLMTVHERWKQNSKGLKTVRFFSEAGKRAGVRK